MQQTTLNLLVSIFVVTLDGAYAVLQRYSLGLLGAVAVIEYTLTLAPHVATGSGLGVGLFVFLLTLMKIGVFYFLATSLYDLLWNGVFYTFLGWGLAAGGGVFSYTDFLKPSSVLDAGFKTAAPLADFLNNMGLIGVFFESWTAVSYLIAYWVIMLGFAMIALHIIMAIIEIKLAIATAAVLIPWGVLSHTAFLAELSISWLTAGMIRILLTATLMAISFPLFESLALKFKPGLVDHVDPQLSQAVTMAVVAFVFAALAWVIPHRAASMGGRGMALALTGGHLLMGGMFGFGLIRAGAQQISQGVSAMMGGALSSSSAAPSPMSGGAGGGGSVSRGGGAFPQRAPAALSSQAGPSRP